MIDFSVEKHDCLPLRTTIVGTALSRYNPSVAHSDGRLCESGTLHICFDPSTNWKHIPSAIQFSCVQSEYVSGGMALFTSLTALQKISALAHPSHGKTTLGAYKMQSSHKFSKLNNINFS